MSDEDIAYVIQTVLALVRETVGNSKFIQMASPGPLPR